MPNYRSDLFFGALTGNGRVLVVDDEPGIRKVVRTMLEKAGYDVVEADNGESAIAAINAGENRLMVDAMICDIRMPKIDGLDTIAYFRRAFPRVPVVVLTGFPDTEMAVDCMRAGVVDYLVKPAGGKRLKEAIEKAMTQRAMAWR